MVIQQRYKGFLRLHDILTCPCRSLDFAGSHVLGPNGTTPQEANGLPSNIGV